MACGLSRLLYLLKRMNLNQQLRTLIEEAPEYGVPAQVMENAVTPVLKLLAQRLQHLEYYTLQTLEGGWVLTILSSSAEPQVEKKVVYAFATVNDAATFQGTPNPQILATAIPVTHILFQLLALKEVDSILFMDTPGDLSTGIEIRRDDLQKLVQMQLQQLGSPSPPKKDIPPNLA